MIQHQLHLKPEYYNSVVIRNGITFDTSKILSDNYIKYVSAGFEDLFDKVPFVDPKISKANGQE